MPPASSPEAIPFADLETPALLLDAAKMDRNIARMSARLADLGVGFRPHLKTCKSIDVARRHFAAGTGPVTTLAASAPGTVVATAER